MNRARWSIAATAVAIVIAAVTVLIFGPARGARDDLHATNETVAGQLATTRESLALQKKQFALAQQELALAQQSHDMAAQTLAQTTALRALAEQTRDIAAQTRNIAQGTRDIAAGTDAKTGRLVYVADQILALALDLDMIGKATLQHVSSVDAKVP